MLTEVLTYLLALVFSFLFVGTGHLLARALEITELGSTTVVVSIFIYWYLKYVHYLKLKLARAHGARAAGEPQDEHAKD